MTFSERKGKKGCILCFDLRSEEVSTILFQRKGFCLYFSLLLHLASYQNCLCLRYHFFSEEVKTHTILHFTVLKKDKLSARFFFVFRLEYFCLL